jgi:hypothetical protein
MWEEIKEQIREEYTDLDDTTIEFYKIALDEYAVQTKCADDSDLLDGLYQEGVLSKKAIRDYYEELEVSEIQKEAGENFDAFKNGLLGAGGMALATAGIVGIGKGYNYLSNKLSRRKKLAQIYKYHPTLRNADQDYVNMALNDIERLNPDVGKSPLISGTAIKNQIYANEGFTPEQAGIIANISPRQTDSQKMIMDSAVSGYGKGYEADKDDYTGTTKHRLDQMKLIDLKAKYKKEYGKDKQKTNHIPTSGANSIFNKKSSAKSIIKSASSLL